MLQATGAGPLSVPEATCMSYFVQIKKFGSKKKSRQRVSKLSKEDVQLQDAGYWEVQLQDNGC